MPEKVTVERAKRALRSGKSPSTAAGEFVREEIEHVREHKHGAASTKQAIAIGLSKARRAGVPLSPPKKGKARTRRSAKKAYEVGQGEREPRAPSARRGQAVRKALKREGTAAASKRALSKQAKSAASRRSANDRSASARRAAATKGPSTRSAAARKAARTRARNTARED